MRGKLSHPLSGSRLGGAAAGGGAGSLPAGHRPGGGSRGRGGLRGPGVQRHHERLHPHRRKGGGAVCQYHPQRPAGRAPGGGNQAIDPFKGLLRRHRQPHRRAQRPAQVYVAAKKRPGYLYQGMEICQYQGLSLWPPDGPSRGNGPFGREPVQLPGYENRGLGLGRAGRLRRGGGQNAGAAGLR